MRDTDRTIRHVASEIPSWLLANGVANNVAFMVVDELEVMEKRS